MRAEQMLAAVQKYNEWLQDYAPERIQATEPYQSAAKTLAHARWMCLEVQSLVAANRLEKAGRWVGFIQGVLWATGHGTISGFKDDNRSLGPCLTDPS